MRQTDAFICFDYLSSLRSLITDAYYDGEAAIPDDSCKKIDALFSNRLLIKTKNNQFRLSTDLKKLLSGIVLSDGIQMIDSELGSHVKSLESNVKIYNAVMTSYDDGNVDIDLLKDIRSKISDVLNGIYDKLDNAVRQVSFRLNSNYASKTDRKIRLQENEYYENQLQNLIDGFVMVRLSFHTEQIRMYPELMMMISNTEIKCISVSKEIQAMVEVIRKYIFSERKRIERMKSLARLEKHLKNNDIDINQFSFEESHNQISLFADPVKINTLINRNDILAEQTLPPIISAVEKSSGEQKEARVKKPSGKMEDTQKTAEIYVNKELLVLEDIFKICKENRKSISICEYFEEADIDLRIDNFLIYVVDFMNKPENKTFKRSTKGIFFNKVIGERVPNFSMNFVINDIHIYHKGITPEELSRLEAIN